MCCKVNFTTTFKGFPLIEEWGRYVLTVSLLCFYFLFISFFFLCFCLVSGFFFGVMVLLDLWLRETWSSLSLGACFSASHFQIVEKALVHE